MSKSVNGIQIRLTDERWRHIVYSHIEIGSLGTERVLQTVEDPDVILKGDLDELLAARKVRKKLWLVVVYKEAKDDGFVITSYVTTDIKWLLKRKIIWNKK